MIETLRVRFSPLCAAAGIAAITALLPPGPAHSADLNVAATVSSPSQVVEAVQDSARRAGVRAPSIRLSGNVNQQILYWSENLQKDDPAGYVRWQSSFAFALGALFEESGTNCIVLASTCGSGGGEDGGASDIRLKRDIAHLTTLENGIKLYSFRYLWSDTDYVGVLAQDLLDDSAFKDAVRVGPGGFFRVNYGALGLAMTTLDRWQERGLAAMAPMPPNNTVGLQAAQ